MKPTKERALAQTKYQRLPKMSDRRPTVTKVITSPNEGARTIQTESGLGPVKTR